MVLTGLLVLGCIRQIVGPDLEEFPEIGSEFNQTKNPVGGGEGYNQAIKKKDTKFVVETADELLNSLSKVKSGDIIFIPGNVTIDLSTKKPLKVSDGITLASDRGINGSNGALLYSKNIQTKKLVIISGNKVRITGLRIEGPDKSIRKSKDMLPSSMGIFVSGYRGIEIDNCEIYGWSFSGIRIQNSEFSHIHHNYIHQNQRTGLGYGIALYAYDKPTFALIEANYFRENRHSIAGSGQPGLSYEARYNYVVRNSNSHSFDMHGDHEKPGTGSQIAGEEIYIHHNTFNINNEGIVIRGRPQKKARIVNNKFLRVEEDVAIRQRYFFGNLEIENNQFKNYQYGWHVSWRGKDSWYRLKNDPNEIGMKNTLVGDFNGDGKSDLLLFKHNKWFYSLSTRNTIYELSQINLEQNSIKEDRSNFYLGDFSGDGETEFLKLVGSKFYRGTVNGFNWSHALSLENGLKQEYVKVGDFDGDGKDDLISSDGDKWYISSAGTENWQQLENSFPSTTHVVVGNFTDKTKDELLFADDSQLFIYDASIQDSRAFNERLERGENILVGDFDGNGFSDLLMQENQILYIKYNARGDWKKFREIDYDLTQIRIGDFDGDAISDILVNDKFLW